MKKSSLTTAVLAGLVGVVGFAGSSNAVEINPDGTGQVLIYPYYTVNNGQQTQFSVVNSTSAGKAVKVRFLEAYNSREVLDFNLFLSPYDVWTGSVFALSDAGISSDGAAFGTADHSCTVPDFSGLPTVGAGLHYQPFSTDAFAGSAGQNYDGGPMDDTRTRVGYLEMIEMADVKGDTLKAITHIKGTPKDCDSALLRDMTNDDFIAPKGGLFGAGSVINVPQGTLYPYVADAIDGFTNRSIMSPSGSLDPNLKSVNSAVPNQATAYVFQQGGNVVTATYPGPDYMSRPIDAVSAVFMASSLMNEWVANTAAGQGTDWVVTFPTKRFYVDALGDNDVYSYVSSYGTAIPPFENFFGSDSTNSNPYVGHACAQVGVHLYDREEGTYISKPGDVFSPAPPGQPPSSLCHEVNVISISTNNTSILGSTMALNVDPTKVGTSGWMSLNLDPSTTKPHATLESDEGWIFNGLPATGFAAQRFINANAAPGMLSNYSGAWHHRIERNITSGD